VTHPATAKTVELLYTEARRRGFELELHFHEWREDREIEAVRSLLSHRVDGLFLTPASLRSEENLVAAFAAEELPPITLFMHRQPPRSTPALRNARQLYFDIPEGCQQALAYLTAQGHTRIAVL